MRNWNVMMASMVALGVGTLTGPPPSQAEETPAGAVRFSSRGFTLQDSSGANLLNLHLNVQPRLILQGGGDPDAEGATLFTGSGFRVRRMQLGADGTVGRIVEFKFQIDTARVLNFTDGSGASQTAEGALLDDAMVNLRLADPFQIAVGQFKAPYSAQWLTSDRTLALPERALTDSGVKYGDVDTGGGFSIGRDVGVMLSGQAPRRLVEWQAGVFSGDGANKWPRTDNGFLYAARVAVNPLGEFKLDEADLKRDKPRLSLAGSVNLNDHPVYDADGERDGATDDLKIGAEARFATRGLLVTGEFYFGRKTDSSSADSSPVSRQGFYLQAGYYLAVAHLLPAVRISHLDPDTGGEDDAVTGIEAAVNVFLPDLTTAEKGDDLGHAGKLQVAYGAVLAQGLDHPLYHSFTLALQASF